MSGVPSREQIRVSFESARNQARQLQQAAEMSRNASDSFRSALQELAVGWPDPLGMEYQSIAGKLAAEMEESASELEQLARAILSAATDFRDAQERARLAASQLDS